MLRNAVAFAFGLPYTVAVYARLHNSPIGITWLLWLSLKEALIGCMIGLLLATPFWAFISIGVLVDNQRGANAAQQANPSLQADSSIIGELIERFLIIVLFETGAFSGIFFVISDSLNVWPAHVPFPNLVSVGLDDYLNAFQRMLSAALRYSSPILVLLLIVEFMFALMSVIVKGMPVYEMAMPIKSLIALVVLSIYATILFSHGRVDVHEWLGWLRTTAIRW
ncbi:hypothetical protein WT37_04325 [Burkholderia territorii]|nr:hypothetical protein WT37_04325 [Burkholderia territorii]